MKSLLLAVPAALVLALALPAVAGGSAKPSAEEKEAFGRLTIQQVEEGVAKKELVVFDNNSQDRFAKGHVPSAKWVKFDNVTAADLPADKATKLVFYCGGEMCMACHEAAKGALTLGYKNVFIMPAGISGWEKAGKKTEKA